MSETARLTTVGRFVALAIAASIVGWLFWCWDHNRNFSGRWEEPFVVLGSPTLLFATVFVRSIVRSLRRGPVIDAPALVRAFAWGIANAICFFLLMAGAALAIMFVSTVLYHRTHVESWQISSLKTTVAATAIAAIAHCGLAVLIRRVTPPSLF